jgi:4-hydroxy-4-methyl-2-oxoglutarate aldolase
LPASIKPLAPHATVAGLALPVRSPSGDNLWLHRAIYAAVPGDVLVVDVGDGIDFGHWSEVMTVAAQLREITGLVITGGVRDGQRMMKMGLPVFSGAVCIRGTGKNPRGNGRVGEPIDFGDVPIRRGDYVLGDADGVVVIAAKRVAKVVDESERRDA